MMMMFNLLIDFIIGLVPFLGDLADAVYKCNTRNAVILEKHLRQKGGRTLASQPRQPTAGIDSGGPDLRERDQNVDWSLPDEWDKAEYGVLDTRSGADNPTGHQPAAQSGGNRSERGWFGGSKKKPRDVEAGHS